MKIIDKLVYYKGYKDGWKKGYELGKSLHDGNCYVFKKKVEKFEPMSPKDLECPEPTGLA